MFDPIMFRVNTIPISQPRQRHSIIAGHIKNYTPADHPVQTFKSAIQYTVKQEYSGALLDEPLKIRIVAVFPRPANMIWKKKNMPRVPKATKPDFDNLAKSVCDALNGVLWRDDSLICKAEIEKYIASGFEKPHVELLINGYGKDL